MNLLIRPLTAEDYHDAARIFFRAVHEGTREFYTEAQRIAWAGDEIDPEHWRGKLTGEIGFVAELAPEAEAAGTPVGFMTIRRSGDLSAYIDLAYVLPDHSGLGVGGRLLSTTEDWACARGIRHLWTHASLRAEGFFASNGWKVSARERVTRNGTALERVEMTKELPVRS